MAASRPETKAASSVALPRYLEIGAVLLILVSAGVLRMAAPGLTEFKADEARLLALALDMAEGKFALRGISSSVGFPNFPASVWIYAIPLLVWPHPYAATLFTGLLNTLAVGGSYWFVRRYWGVTAGLAATMMSAVSPWAVIFSRKIWAQNLLPFFVVGWAITAALSLVEERPRFIWLHFLFLALAVQIHLAAAALLPATVLLLLIFRRRVRWRAVLVGLGIAALTLLPFALYLWQQRARIMVPQFGGSVSGAGLTADSLLYTVMISLGSNIHSLAGAAVFRDFLALLPPMGPVYWIWGILIAAGIIWLAWQAWSNWNALAAQAGVVVLIWLLLPPLFFLWHYTPVFLHYFIAALPAPYIAAGAAFSRIPKGITHLRPGAGQKSKTLILWGLWGIFLLTIVAQLWATATLIDFVGRTATPGAFGVPLEMKLETADRARALLAEDEASEILVAGEGESPGMDEFPAVWDVLLRDVPHRFVDARHSALFPAEGAVVILDGRDGTQPWTGDLYQEAAVNVEAIPLRPGEGAFYVLTLDEEAKPEPENPSEEPLLLANWVNLLGSDRLRRVDAETGVWQVHWRTADNPDPANYQFFNHLIDVHELRVGQKDEAAFAPWQWRAGDTVISRFLIPWPETAEGPFKMRVGMYRYPSLENVPLLDEAGHPYLDAATFSIDNNG